MGEDSSNRKFLVSRLFDVAEGSTLEESSSSCIRLEWNKGIVGHVAATGQPLNIKNAYEVRMSHCTGINLEAGEAHLMVSVAISASVHVKTNCYSLWVDLMVLADRALAGWRGGGGVSKEGN